MLVENLSHDTSVQVVVQWVVGPLGIQTDLDVVALTTTLGQNLSYPAAESSFDFEHKSARLGFGGCCPVSPTIDRYSDTYSN